MTHQSVVLIWTLVVMFGIPAGYFLAWLGDWAERLGRAHAAIWRLHRLNLALVDLVGAVSLAQHRERAE